MSKTVTKGALRTRAQYAANMEGSTFVSNAEWDTYANVHTQAVYDMLVDASPPDYYSTDNTITTTAGTIAYALPSDFRSLQMVYAAESSTRYRPLEQVSDIELMAYDAPQGTYTVILRYTPTFTDYVNDNSTFDGVSGWDELIVAYMARDALMKEESAIDAVQLKIQGLEARIQSLAGKRNQGASWPISDTDAISRYPFPYRQAVSAYHLRGGYLDLYSAAPVWP